MSFNDQKSRFRALDDWFRTSQGMHVGNAFSRELASIESPLRGDILLQLGCCGDNPWLQTLPYDRQWVATPYYSNAPACELITSFNQLPLDRNSVDCVLVPLTMNAFTRDKNPLDEIDRVLKPMGHVIFWGINPVSLWGIFMRMGRFSCFGPLSAKMMSVLFIKYAMLHRGYVQCSLSNFYYIFPTKQKKWRDKLEILNELGKMIWPCPAGFYCLVVQKYQISYPTMLVDKITNKLLDARSIQPIC